MLARTPSAMDARNNTTFAPGADGYAETEDQAAFGFFAVTTGIGEESVCPSDVNGHLRGSPTIGPSAVSDEGARRMR